VSLVSNEPVASARHRAESLEYADNGGCAEKIAFQTGSMCFAGVLSQDKLKTWLKGTERLGRR